MRMIESIVIENITHHQVKETTIKSVLVSWGDNQPLMSGQAFKNVIFMALDGNYYIIIGDNDRYSETCGMTGIASTTNLIWYETTKEEGNAIYKKIISTKVVSKKGNTYYKFSFHY